MFPVRQSSGTTPVLWDWEKIRHKIALIITLVFFRTSELTSSTPTDEECFKGSMIFKIPTRLKTVEFIIGKLIWLNIRTSSNRSRVKMELYRSFSTEDHFSPIEFPSLFPGYTRGFTFSVKFSIIVLRFPLEFSASQYFKKMFLRLRQRAYIVYRRMVKVPLGLRSWLS